jgi:hypothetical protein
MEGGLRCQHAVTIWNNRSEENTNFRLSPNTVHTVLYRLFINNNNNNLLISLI